MNLYQDVTEIVDADAATIHAVTVAVLFLAVTTAVYGSSFFSSSVADAVEAHGVVTDVVVAEALTAVSGSSFFSSSAADAATIHVAIMDADVTIASANLNLL